MGNILGYGIVVVISVALAFLGRTKFASNEPKVIELQSKKHEVEESGETVSATLEADLKKATALSINMKKLEILGYTVTAVVIIFGVIKLFIS